MILDERTEFCDATALNTGGAGSYLLGDHIDTSIARDLGNGKDVEFVVSVDTTATSGGSATLTVNLITSANSDMSSPTVIVGSPTFALAAITAGTTLFRVQIPASANWARYVGVQQVTGTAAFTGGAVSAFLTPAAANWRSYNDAI